MNFSMGTPQENESGLKKELGLWTATAIVVSQMIGIGIFMTPQGLAELANPLSAIAGMAITSIGCLFLAICFARLGERYPITGSAVVYTKMAFGELPAFFVGWSYYFGCWIANGAIILGGFGYLSYFFPILAESNGLPVILSITVIWIYTFINALGIKSAGIINLILTIIKIFPLLLFLVLAIPAFHAENFAAASSLKAGGMGSIPVSMAYCLWSFMGLEGASVVAAEVKEPRIVRTATFLGTGIVVAVYLLVLVLSIGAMPQNELAASTSPLADILIRITGSFWVGGLIAFGVFVSAAGCMGAWILSTARMAYSLGEQGFFPAGIAKVNKKTGAPITALYVNAVLMTIIMLLGFFQITGSLYNFMVMLAVMGFLVFYAFGALSEIMLTRKFDKPLNILSFIKNSVIGLIAFAYAVYTVWGAGPDYALYGFILLLIGIPFFMYAKISQRP